MPGWLVKAWDRLVASDPGMSRLRMAMSGVAAMASALGVELGFATAMNAGATNTLIAMLLGAIVSMMGSMALTGTGVWSKVRTAVFFPVAIGVGMLIGVGVGGRTDLMLGVFVAVMFAAVFVRRFGAGFFFYGFMGWMGYFFASFLHATWPMMPFLIAAVAVGAAWVLLLSVTVLRTNPTRTLRRTVSAFDARARELSRASAELLQADHADTRQRERLRRRVRTQQARLNEAALMVEGWSAEPGALPPGRSAAALRRRLIDAQQLLDTMAASADALADAHSTHSAFAGQVAARLARRDDSGADRAARALAAAVEQNATGWSDTAAATETWLPARHFAAAVIEFVALAREARDPPPIHDPLDDTVDVFEPEEFEPAVGLAMGNLPGSPAFAGDVPARGSRWNPLARLDLNTRQAIQVGIAGGLAILAGRELSPTRYYWAVIAAFIMFTGTATRTETFVKGANRVLGTMVGLLASIWLAQLTTGHIVWMLLVIVASMFCGFYLIRLSYAYMIFFITIMVAQLYTVLHEFTPGLLVLRLEETAIGAAIGFLVALVVVPLSTRDTVRTARDNLFTALADLLTAAADRLQGQENPEQSLDLDALSRVLDDRLRQLALVAKPLTRPLLGGTGSLSTRHRLALYAATSTHARALAVAMRTLNDCAHSDCAAACRALATTAIQLTETKPGQAQPAAAVPLAEADAALFDNTSATPDTHATDPIIHALIRLHSLLRELTATPQPEYVPASELQQPTR